MEHCRPKRPADSTGAGQVWTHQGLALNGGEQPTGVLVAGQNAAPAAWIPFRQSAVRAMFHGSRSRRQTLFSVPGCELSAPQRH